VNEIPEHCGISRNESAFPHTKDPPGSGNGDTKSMDLKLSDEGKKTHAIEDTMESTTCDGQSSNIEVALRKKQNGEDMTDDPLCDLKVASLARPNENNVYLLTQLETVMLNNKNRHETWDEEGVDLKERVDRMLEKKVRREASDKIDPNRTEVADCKIDPVDLIESSEHGGDGLDRLLEL